MKPGFEGGREPLFGQEGDYPFEGRWAFGLFFTLLRPNLSPLLVLVSLCLLPGGPSSLRDKPVVKGSLLC